MHPDNDGQEVFDRHKDLAGHELAFHARSALRGCASREALPVSDFVKRPTLRVSVVTWDLSSGLKP
eukprot:5724076-Alexandrium_andersonii.AAC.1